MSGIAAEEAALSSGHTVPDGWLSDHSAHDIARELTHPLLSPPLPSPPLRNTPLKPS